MAEKIFLLDTTGRDGSQGEKIELSEQDKEQIAEKIDDLGIDFNEAGYPGSNPKDKAFYQELKKKKFKNSKIVAFGSTRKPRTDATESIDLTAIAASGAPTGCIYGKTWDLHVKYMTKSSLRENLMMIKESVEFLINHKLEVIYDAEHFFQGYLANPDYALRTLKTAFDAGAKWLVLCDTNGGTLPHEIEEITKKVVNFFKREANIGIHAHNDCGLAVANTIAAVKAGARMVQGTINGYGERCGNADLTTIIPILQLKMGYKCIGNNIKKLTQVSKFVDDIANRVPFDGRPFVGRSAFAHKGGAHLYFFKKDPATYQHMDPKIVGNESRVLISEMAGKSNLELKSKELGYTLTDDQLKTLVSVIKQKEKEGESFEEADASLSLLIEQVVQGENFEAPFEFESFRVTIVKEKNSPCSSEATVCITPKGGESIFKGSPGNGPVDALKKALLMALGKAKKFDRVRLRDYKVRVDNGNVGTDARVKVSMAFGNAKNTWTTAKSSEDIIEASWKAMFEAMMYHLRK